MRRREWTAAWEKAKFAPVWSSGRCEVTFHLIQSRNCVRAHNVFGVSDDKADGTLPSCCLPFRFPISPPLNRASNDMERTVCTHTHTRANGWRLAAGRGFRETGYGAEGPPASGQHKPRATTQRMRRPTAQRVPCRGLHPVQRKCCGARGLRARACTTTAVLRDVGECRSTVDISSPAPSSQLPAAPSSWLLRCCIRPRSNRLAPIWHPTTPKKGPPAIATLVRGRDRGSQSSLGAVWEDLLLMWKRQRDMKQAQAVSPSPLNLDRISRISPQHIFYTEPLT